MTQDHVAWFEDLRSGDVARVSGKNASFGEMVRALKDKGVRVPDGCIAIVQCVAQIEAAAGEGIR